jgi:hypothetical protein
VPLQARLDQAVRAQTVEVAPHCLMGHAQRFGNLTDGCFTVAADDT